MQKLCSARVEQGKTSDEFQNRLQEMLAAKRRGQAVAAGPQESRQENRSHFVRHSRLATGETGAERCILENMLRRFLAASAAVFVHTALLAQGAGIVSAVRRAAWAKDLVTAERLVAEYRSQNPALTPQMLEANSWVARGASFAKNWEKAEAYAREVFDGSQTLLRQRPLDADKSLPLALGAAIEVLAGVQDAHGDRPGALEFLRAERARHKGTSIEARLQKNILLLSLEGESAPPLEIPQWIGARPKALAELKGQVVLLFFWAHWCGDCKKQMPAIERLVAEFGGRGLAVVGPTRLYGYIARGEPANPEQEMTYLRADYRKAHPTPAWMSVPVSAENFRNFGVSTTPTLMLVDRAGAVRLYYPGALSYETLAARIEPLLRPRT